MFTVLMGTALAVVATNAPAAFSTEAERTFPLPSAVAADGRFVCDLVRSCGPSNRVELVWGADADADGVLGDGERNLALDLEGDRLVLSDGNGEVIFEEPVQRPFRDFSCEFTPSRLARPGVWRMSSRGEGVSFSGEFPETVEPLGWTHVRVRMNGPTVDEVSVTLQAVRAGVVLRFR